jgi:protein-disulfide isomerase
MRTTIGSVFLAAALSSSAGTLGCSAEGGRDNKVAETPADTVRHHVPLLGTEQAMGSAQPLVTLVVFGDYLCAPCAGLWSVLRHLPEEYGDDLRIVHRSMARSGSPSDLAADAAYAAAEQGKFWDYHYSLYAQPAEWTDALLVERAESLGLDVARFRDDLATGTAASARLQDSRAALALGVMAAPVAFLNGIPLIGPTHEDAQWHAMIDGELALARRLVDEGTPRAEVLAAITKGASTEALEEPEAVRRMRDEANAKAQASQVDYGGLVAYDPQARYAVPVTGAPSIGPADAPVVMVVYGDFECPYSRRANAQLVSRVRAERGSDVRIVARQFPLEFHRAASGAARAALAAGRQGPERYWAYADALFAHEGMLGRSSFEATAQQLGLDLDQFNKDFDDPALDLSVESDRLGALALGVSATPTFVVNGRVVEGLVSWETLAAMIDAELSATSALQDSGVARDALHAARMRGAIEPDAFPNAGAVAGAIQPNPSSAGE